MISILGVILSILAAVIMVQVFHTDPVNMFFGFFIGHYRSMHYWSIALTLCISVFFISRYNEWMPEIGQKIGKCNRSNGRIRRIVLLIGGVILLLCSFYGIFQKEQNVTRITYEQAFRFFNDGSHMDLERFCSIIKGLSITYQKNLLIAGILLIVYSAIKSIIGNKRACTVDSVCKENYLMKGMIRLSQIAFLVLPTIVLIFEFDNIAFYFTGVSNASNHVISKPFILDVKKTDCMFFEMLSLYIWIYVSTTFNLMSWLRLSCSAKTVAIRFIILMIGLPISIIISLIPAFCLFLPFSFILPLLILLLIIGVIGAIFGQSGEPTEEDKLYAAINSVEFCGSTLVLEKADIDRLMNATQRCEISPIEINRLKRRLEENGRSIDDSLLLHQINLYYK